MKYLLFSESKSRRSIIRVITLTIILLAVTVSVMAQDTARENGSNLPTIVLVHGAWADPSGWNEVVGRLQRDGYTTVTPTLDLVSIDGDVSRVRTVLDSIPDNKILVAHSYGGIVISNAAYSRSDVLALVYSAAFVPDAGDTILSLGQGFTQSEAFNHLIFTGEPFASPAYIDPAFFPQFFAQDLNPHLASSLNNAQRPINAPILFTPSGPVAWHTIPSWYAVSNADLMIDPAQQNWMAQRAGATIITFDDASHIGGITHYNARFVKLIEDAVAATAQ